MFITLIFLSISACIPFSISIKPISLYFLFHFSASISEWIYSRWVVTFYHINRFHCIHVKATSMTNFIKRNGLSYTITSYCSVICMPLLMKSILIDMARQISNWMEWKIYIQCNSEREKPTQNYLPSYFKNVIWTITDGRFFKCYRSVIWFLSGKPLLGHLISHQTSSFIL